MKNRPIIYITVLLWTVTFFSCNQEKSKNDFKGTSQKFQILKQDKKRRIFLNKLLLLVKEIPFKDLNSEIFLPTEVGFDSHKNIYIYDRPEKKIHKLSHKQRFTEFSHMVFKNRSIEGRGPGEVTRLLDFKVYKNHVYLLDEGSNTLIIYSDKGSLIKQIKIKSNKTILLRKLTFSGGMPVLCTYGMHDLFYRCNYKGEIQESFGKYIDRNHMDNILYHQYCVSKPIEQKYFFYLPLYLGIVGFYDGDRLQYVKETIDGRRFPEFLKENIGGAIITRMKGMGSRTVHKYAITQDLILIKSSDMEKRIYYWDFYKVKNFDYMFSIKNPPISNDFDIKENYLVSVNENGIKIFDIKLIIKRIKNSTSRD